MLITRTSQPFAGLYGQLLVIACAVLIVFSPAIFAEYSLVDDAETVASLQSGGILTFKTLFLPGAKDGGYYRPLIGLSHLLDRDVWQMDTRVVHLENILLHLLNALWLFLLVRLNLPLDRRGSSRAPLAASLIFGLHPVVTESVNWYSGRTDLIAATLILPGLCALSFWRTARKMWLILVAIPLVLLAVLAKESALAVLMILPFFMLEPRGMAAPSYEWCKDRYIYLLLLVPALSIGLYLFKFWPALLMSLICFVIVAWRESGRSAHLSDSRLLTVVKIPILAFVLSVTLVGGIFGGLRQIAYNGRLPRIGSTFTLMFQDIDYAIGMFLGGIGFYVKKFIFPIPLNFAIREIDPLYQLVGVAICFLAVYLIFNRTQWSLFALMGLVLLSPALPFVFGTIAWTSYAERYMYLSTAFWAGSCAFYCAGWQAKTGFKRSLLVMLVMVMGCLSLWRSNVWRTNVTLLADTVDKSPGFKDLRAFYMLALFLNGDLEGAQKQYLVASAIPSLVYNPKFDVVYARILLAQGKTRDARNVLESVLEKTGGASTDAANALQELEWTAIDTMGK